MNKKKLTLIFFLLLIIPLAVIGFKKFGSEPQTFNLETIPVNIGSVSNTVTATGTIQAIRTVEVGTQVSGVISKIYADFNSQVKKDQLLAELDRRPLVTALDNAQASFDNAQAESTYQKSNYGRVNALYEKGLIAQADYDLALYNYTKSQASLKISTSELERAKINLGYASVYSPIDGVILNRAVDEGQTVAASFNTPTLFTIANDLTQMQVEASIDEADIGNILKGQKVFFTVDAFPDMEFAGEVTEIRLQPVTKSNVVTYTVIINAPNPEKKLMPGMTASITILVEEVKDVLLVPAKALQFMPDRNNQNIKIDWNSFSQIDKNDSTSVLWIKKGALISPVNVITGIDDNVNVQIISGINKGDEVVLSMNTENVSVKSDETVAESPFLPHPPNNKKK